MEEIEMRVSPESISSLCREMKQCDVKIQKAIKSINDTYKKINTYWESTFWTQCYASIEKQKDTAFQVCENLKSIERSTEEIAMNYNKVEKMNQVSASKLSGCVIK